MAAALGCPVVLYGCDGGVAVCKRIEGRGWFVVDGVVMCGKVEGADVSVSSSSHRPIIDQTHTDTHKHAHLVSASHPSLTHRDTRTHTRQHTRNSPVQRRARPLVHPLGGAALYDLSWDSGSENESQIQFHRPIIDRHVVQGNSLIRLTHHHRSTKAYHQSSKGDSFLYVPG